MNETKQAVVARRCYDCNGTMEGRRENYRYTECGLESVTLLDILVFHCKCGAIVPEISAVEMLHEAIAIDLLRKDTFLSGEEIRFLRKTAGYSATKLAAIMGVTKEAVSRWENDKQPIGKESDRLVRWVCFDGIMRNVIPGETDKHGILIEHVKKMASLNLPEFMQQIEDSARGSKSIKVNPAMLAQFGSDCMIAPENNELVLH